MCLVDSDDPNSQEFSSWLLEIGHGCGCGDDGPVGNRYFTRNRLKLTLKMRGKGGNNREGIGENQT